MFSFLISRHLIKKVCIKKKFTSTLYIVVENLSGTSWPASGGNIIPVVFFYMHILYGLFRGFYLSV